MVFFRRHFILMFFQALFLLGCSGFDEIKVSFGPSFWREHDPNSDLFVDHRAWGYLLEKHIMEKVVKYTEIRIKKNLSNKQNLKLVENSIINISFARHKSIKSIKIEKYFHTFRPEAQNPL